MKKANKILLIWALVSTIAVLAFAFSACSDSRVSWSVSQIEAQSVTIQGLQSDLSNAQATIKNLQSQIGSLQSFADANIKSLSGDMQKNMTDIANNSSKDAAQTTYLQGEIDNLNSKIDQVVSNNQSVTDYINAKIQILANAANIQFASK